MFEFFKRAYAKIYNTCSYHFRALFNRSHIDENALKELEKTLLEADTGVTTTRAIMQTVRSYATQQKLSGQDVQSILRNELLKRAAHTQYQKKGNVYMLVGVNGSGKTSCAGKLAKQLQSEGKRVLLVAADTFRAAAIEQLVHFAHTCKAPYVAGEPGQDPSSVVYKGCQRYVREEFDAVIIDTAGRLQTKQHLMQEVEKMMRVAQKHVSAEDITTLLTLDALLGQNSYDQATLFHKTTNVAGVILTKMDATAKGGIVFSVMEHLNLPVAYTTFGEQLTDIAPFEPYEYIDNLLEG